MRKKKQGSSYSNKRTRSIIYIAVMGFCIILLAVMVILSAQQIQKNQILKAKEAEIVEKYKNVAQENNNIKDQDYADIYFEGNNIFIPYEDVIIEYEP
ncbi:MAG: hypothetical protein MSA42_06635 [Mollicutes bacterium]|nr:hypothetical protein [Mollicutes bacterium]MDY3209605.1 hypothetical protein [Candidatus Enterosoma sp.]MCI7133370.1 hypothetical protein [Mollicutes bacterium]MCI7789112.1 hypothetical protein [Mollicutes bacterium]MDD7613137.1 hypothetical protein [Mollicutes bacterium]